MLIPGVIDTTTNFIEHPRVVANRLRGFVELVGAERVMAGTDCGFSTFAGFGAVDPDIVYAKLATLAEGALVARLAMTLTACAATGTHLAAVLLGRDTTRYPTLVGLAMQHLDDASGATWLTRH